MKKAILTLLFSFIFCLISHEQYVTLEGRQFKDENGNDFYPVVCCYGFQVCYNNENPSIEDYYLSPINGYGEGLYLPGYPQIFPNYEYENDNQADCRAQIHADFQKIHDMGFNAIRTAGLGATKIETNLPMGITGFKVEAIRNIHPLWDPPKKYIELLPNYETNTNTLKLFSFIDIILEEAESSGLKVLLETGLGDLTYTGKFGVNYLDYADYLTALAGYFSNNSTLMGYVVIDEPLYSGQSCGYTKNFICEMTSSWYDAIKSVDSHHLVTMGGTPTLDYLEWDPGVMKIDFYSPHIYPSGFNYEGYDQSIAYSRVLDNMILLNNICPMPWIIGETGFSAIDDYYQFIGGNWVSYTYSQPYVDGNIYDQQIYAEDILQNVRDCGASGFSWWNYQENWWNPYQDGFGLLRHSNLLDPNVEKPVVSSFENYPSPPPPPQIITTPSNYLQPYATVGSYFPISGQVFDQDNNILKDVIVFAWNNWSKRPKVIFNIYALANESGQYTISIPLDREEYCIDYLRATAIGSSVNDAAPPFESPQYFQIHKNITGYDLNINNIFVDIGITKKYKGWYSLSLSNVTVNGNGYIGGDAEFSAREVVNVNNEFSAKEGSEVHILNMATFQDCGAIPFKVDKDASQLLRASNIYDQHNIELQFDNCYNNFLISPNPAVNKFKILMDSQEYKKKPIINVSIFNTIGIILLQLSNVDFNSTIDISSLPRGIYLIQIIDTENSSSVFKKIILQ